MKETSNQKSFIFRTKVYLFFEQKFTFSKKRPNMEKRKITKRKIRIFKPMSGRGFNLPTTRTTTKIWSQFKKSEFSFKPPCCYKTYSKRKSVFFFKFPRKKKNPKKFCFKTFATFSKMLGFLLLQWNQKLQRNNHVKLIWV
jgi:hypothetical protein